MPTLENEFLTAAEVKDVTGCIRADAQETELKRQGLPFKRRGERILISRFHTREWLAGRTVTPSRGINLALAR
jgi:hypothetical protein